MVRSRSWCIICFVVALASLAACGGPPTPVAVTASASPDPCAAPQLVTTIGAIETVMRKFDDESALAANVPRSELAARISALQNIRREAQALTTPACVRLLSQLQILHMNTVIDTLLAFMSRGDQAEVTLGIQAGRQQHDAYVLELARLQGKSPATAVLFPPTVATGSPEVLTATPAPTIEAVTGFIVVNPGPDVITMRAVPSTAGDALATLAVGQSARALGGSADGQWIQVVLPEHPYQTAWVQIALVQVTIPTP